MTYGNRACDGNEAYGPTWLDSVWELISFEEDQSVLLYR